MKFTHRGQKFISSIIDVVFFTLFYKDLEVRSNLSPELFLQIFLSVIVVEIFAIAVKVTQISPNTFHFGKLRQTVNHCTWIYSVVKQCKLLATRPKSVHSTYPHTSQPFQTKRNFPTLLSRRLQHTSVCIALPSKACLHSSTNNSSNNNVANRHKPIRSKPGGRSYEGKPKRRRRANLFSSSSSLAMPFSCWVPCSMLRFLRHLLNVRLGTTTLCQHQRREVNCTSLTCHSGFHLVEEAVIMTNELIFPFAGINIIQ